jgi:glycosyltransferase involved in cell wall biosynthesis
VILPVRNAGATIADQLAGLSRQVVDRPWELLVVDNGCTDNTLTVVEQWKPRLGEIRVVPAHDRAGLAHARNVGVAAARGGVVAFCDGDDIVADGWAQALLDGCGDAELVGGALDVEQLNDPPSIYWRGGSPTAAGPPLAHRLFPIAVGANFAARRGTIDEVGGFDEQFLICSDDVDFSWRVQQAGGRFCFANSAVVRYRFRPDLRTNLRQQWNYGRAEARLYEKFRPQLQRAPLSDVARTYWFLLSRSHHLVRGELLRGRWLCMVVYRLGRLRGSWERRKLWW